MITTSFVVVSKQAKPKKSGAELYLALTLADRTGHLDAKMWDNVADHINCFEQDDFVKVRGLLNKFNGRFQLTLHEVRHPWSESEVEFEDYLPRTTKDIGALWQTVRDFVDTIRDPHLQALLRAFMADPQIEHAGAKMRPRPRPCTALLSGACWTTWSHSSSSVIWPAAITLRPSIVTSLLTGAFLHDIGKIHELTFSRSFTYTTRGQLLGHMIIELEMLHQKIAQVPGFPDEYKTLIEHLIISHHGKYEFGSPKMPMFPEALMLHYLDVISIPKWRACAHISSVSQKMSGPLTTAAWPARF